MTEVKRNNFVDVAKGLAIFLMLWGHCLQYCTVGSGIDFYENTAFKVIYSFHMPLFMLVSGYLFFFSFSKRSLGELLVRRTQTLLQPLFLGTLFNFLISTALFGVLSGDFSVLFDGQWLQSLPSLWFLWSVLVASVATALACKICKNAFLQILLLLAAAPLLAFFPNAEMNLFMYPYFLAGFFYAKNKERLSRSFLQLKYLCIPLFVFLLFFYEKKHYIYTTGLFPSQDYPLSEMLVINGFRFLVGLIGTVGVLSLLHFVYLFVSLKIKRPLLSTMLSALGRRSLQIYVLSLPLLSFYLPRLLEKALALLGMENVFAQNALLYTFGFTLPVAILYSFVLHLFVILLEKCRLSRLLFGK